MSTGETQAEREVRARIDAIVRADDVVLFMKGTPRTPLCGFSGRVVRILNTLGVPFRAVEVLQSDAMREGIKVYSDWPTIPQLYIKGEFMGGCDIVEDLYDSGSLEETMRAHNIPQKT